MSLAKTIERERQRLPPAPVSVNAVRGQTGSETNLKSLVQEGNELQSLNVETANAPDYFYGDSAW